MAVSSPARLASELCERGASPAAATPPAKAPPPPPGSGVAGVAAEGVARDGRLAAGADPDGAHRRAMTRRQGRL